VRIRDDVNPVVIESVDDFDFVTDHHVASVPSVDPRAQFRKAPKEVVHSRNGRFKLIGGLRSLLLVPTEEIAVFLLGIGIDDEVSHGPAPRVARYCEPRPRISATAGLARTRPIAG